MTTISAQIIVQFLKKLGRLVRYGLRDQSRERLPGRAAFKWQCIANCHQL